MLQKTLELAVKPSAQTAINAVALVRHKLGVDYCAFIVQPNAVLTLADARGYADSVFYHPDTAVLTDWQESQKTILSLLAETRDLTFKVSISKNVSGEKYTGFDLINRAALAYSFNSYSFLTRADKSILIKAPTILQLMSTLQALLKQKPIFAKYHKDQIMHIAGGVLLGYPEKAILATVGNLLAQPDEFSPQDINADIRGAAYYSCPQPVYSYPRYLATDPDITAHEQLWSQILMDFYRSDVHQELAQNKAFQRKIRSLSKY